MLPKLVLAAIVLCVFIVVTSGDRGYCKKCFFIPNRRIKRGKYYSNPPQRFYSRPPVSFPHIGAFSYTPPPNYMVEDDSPYPGPPGSRPYKVSSHPNEGLADEEINNLMKYLTKQDLDKILDFANGQRQKNQPLYKFDKENNNYIKKANLSLYKAETNNNEVFSKNYDNEEEKEEANHLFKANVQYIDQSSASNSRHQEQTPYKYTESINYVTESIPQKHYTEIYKMNPSESEQRIVNKQINFDDALETELADSDTNTENSFSEAGFMPKPLNLREEQDFYGSFTNNVPKVVPSESYKVESFGDLPLMNYNSKLDSVSSYHVPHYTVSVVYF